MSNKTSKDMKTCEINGFPMHLELYDSEIIIRDENGNCMRISKKDKFSIILDLIGNFKSN